VFESAGRSFGKTPIFASNANQAAVRCDAGVVKPNSWPSRFLFPFNSCAYRDCLGFLICLVKKKVQTHSLISVFSFNLFFI